MKIINHSGKDMKLWFEICTNNFEDWKHFLSLCAQSFQNTEFAKRYLPDVEKRKLFLPHYFNYNYETKFSDGRAGLACLKTMSEDGKSEIVLGSVTVFDPLLVTDGDQTSMLEAYKEGTELVMKRDMWLQRAVHTPMAEVGKNIGALPFYGAYQAVNPKYKTMGLGAKYMPTTHRMLEEEGRRIKQTKLPLFVYALQLQSSLLNSQFVKATKVEEVAHLHFNYREGLVCSQSSNYMEGKEISCVHVLCPHSHASHSVILPTVKKYFEQSSKL